MNTMQTHDCPATLTDRQVAEFCKNGYLILSGVVGDAVNARACSYADMHPEIFPNGLMDEPWFVDGVLKNPAAAGAVRSLLGRGFEMPRLMVNHRQVCPKGSALGWHVDGGSRWTAELNDLQVFYLPQDTPIELGPTQLLPGSHLVPNTARAMAHLGVIRGTISTNGPAGSIFITAYRIWHRAGSASGTGVRNLFKYCYSRAAAPVRDWIREPEFDLASYDFTGPAQMLGEQFHECYSAAEMFVWLSGRHDQFKSIGGQGWPVPGPRIGRPYGFNEGLLG